MWLKLVRPEINFYNRRLHCSDTGHPKSDQIRQLLSHAATRGSRSQTTSQKTRLRFAN